LKICSGFTELFAAQGVWCGHLVNREFSDGPVAKMISLSPCAARTYGNSSEKRHLTIINVINILMCIIRRQFTERSSRSSVFSSPPPPLSHFAPRKQRVFPDFPTQSPSAPETLLLRRKGDNGTNPYQLSPHSHIHPTTSPVTGLTPEFENPLPESAQIRRWAR
jgi:hypothetical protein